MRHVVTTIKDGFGNQLFMYACGYAAAKERDAKLVLDATELASSNLRRLEITKMKIKYDILIDIPVCLPNLVKYLYRHFLHILMKLFIRIYKERITYEFDENVLSNKGTVRLYGYWQSEQYFKKYRKELLVMFSPRYNTTESFNKLMKEIERTNSVSIHVRRGDFVSLRCCLSKSYYLNAIRYILSHVREPHFFVFSDDNDYSAEMFKDLKLDMNIVRYSAIDSTIEDFLLMKSCKHNILANSSYSWWGAWANENNEKIVVCPPPGNLVIFFIQSLGTLFKYNFKTVVSLIVILINLKLLILL